MGVIPKAFRQREPVFLWRNGNEFKTNHHHHQSVACDLLVGGTRMGFHCTQVNCSQNRYDIKEMLFACGRCWIQSRWAPRTAFRLVAPSSCVFAVYSLELFIGQGNWDQSRGMVGTRKRQREMTEEHTCVWWYKYVLKCYMWYACHPLPMITSLNCCHCRSPTRWLH